jgi:hypothetical protein
MKKITQISLMVLLPIPFFLATAQTPVEDHIKYIRKEFNLINDICSQLNPVVIQSDTLYKEGLLEMKQWATTDRIVKFQLIRFKGKDKFVNDFYFGEGGLIFTFSQEFLSDEFGDPYVKENRYYFKDDDTLIRWLDEDKKEIDPSSTQFRQQGSDIWEDMHWAVETFWMIDSAQN